MFVPDGMGRAQPAVPGLSTGHRARGPAPALQPSPHPGVPHLLLRPRMAVELNPWARGIFSSGELDPQLLGAGVRSGLCLCQALQCRGREAFRCWQMNAVICPVKV